VEETVPILFNVGVLFRHPPGGTEENYEKPVRIIYNQTEIRIPRRNVLPVEPVPLCGIEFHTHTSTTGKFAVLLEYFSCVLVICSARIFLAKDHR
jgi:hypothetical protein